MNEMPEIDFLGIIDKSFNRAKQMIQTVSKQSWSPTFDYKVFSDNIVVATNAEQVERPYSKSLYAMICMAFILQREFISRGVMCRGAITKGKLCLNPEYVFGSGLIRAYDLESAVAFYPRIILDRLSEVEELITEDMVYIGHDECDEDSDGYKFINYMAGEISGTGIEQLCTHSDLLNIHRLFVINGLEKHKENERVFQKYAWCREYHNLTCKRFKFPDLCIE